MDVTADLMGLDLVNTTTVSPRQVIPYIQLIQAKEYIRYLDIPVVPIGIFGSIFTLIVVTRSPSLLKSSMAIYLGTIAVSDGFRLAMDYIFLVGRFTSSLVAWLCQGLHFLSFANALISDILVAAVAVDRTIATIWPHRAKILCTQSKAKIVVSVIIVFEIGMTLQALWTFTVNQNGSDCARVIKYKTLLSVIGPLILTMKLIAFFIILVSTIVIIISLRRQRRRMASLQGGSGQAVPPNKDAQITAMLVSIAILYVFTNFPIMLVTILPNLTDMSRLGALRAPLFGLLYEMAALLKMLNHTLNFYIYCMSAQFFRQEFMNVLRCKKTMK